jgi:hypothetical protein
MMIPLPLLHSLGLLSTFEGNLAMYWLMRSFSRRPYTLSRKPCTPQYFSKYGVLRQNEETGKPLVRLYRDEAGLLKGDGRVGFLKKPSLDLAIQLGNGSVMREGEGTLTVVEAVFQQKGGEFVKKDVDEEAKKKRAKLIAAQKVRKCTTRSISLAIPLCQPKYSTPMPLRSSSSGFHPTQPLAPVHALAFLPILLLLPWCRAP